jgi:hypothetical protein
MKTNKWLMTALMAVGLMGVTLGVGGCKEKESGQSGNSAAKEHAVQYTCSMHPDVVQDKPGKCPKCGMDLVEKK